MPSSSEPLLAEIFSKIEQLAARQAEAEATIRHLEEELADTRAELADTRAQLTRSRLDAEFLTLSHRLADTPEGLLTARRIIASLIRKVDAAITMVKNDPAEQ